MEHFSVGCNSDNCNRTVHKRALAGMICLTLAWYGVGKRNTVIFYTSTVQ